MIWRLLCRIGYHGHVYIRDCIVTCAHCGRVIDRLPPPEGEAWT